MTSHCVCAVTTSHRRQCVRQYDVMCLLGKTGDDRNTKAKMYEEIMEDKETSVVVVLLFYVHGKHLRSCRDGQLTSPHFSWAGLDLLSG